MTGTFGLLLLASSSGVTMMGMDGESPSPDTTMEGTPTPSSGVTAIDGMFGIVLCSVGASTEILGMDGVLDDGCDVDAGV